MIIPVIERLTRQIERTLQHYTTSTGRERVEKLYISSVMNIDDPILNYLNEQLGVNIELFDPFKYQTESGVAETISLADRIALVPALGLSFSCNQHTPNLIFTYKDKNNETSIKRINRGIIAAFAAALVVCMITISYQGGYDCFKKAKSKSKKRNVYV